MRLVNPGRGADTAFCSSRQNTHFDFAGENQQRERVRANVAYQRFGLEPISAD